MKKLLLVLALLFAPSLAWGQCNGVFPANTVCGSVLGGAPGSTAGVFPAGNNTWTGRQTFNYTPVFDLASNTMAVALFFPNPTITVPAGDIYHDIRMSSASGASPTITIGAGGLYSSIYVNPIIGSGSSVSSNGYGAVLQATNAGSGAVKGIHGGCFGSGSSTGTCIGVNLQIQPVSTQGYTSGTFASLTSSGVNNLAAAYGVESNGDQYFCALCNAIASLPIGTDFIRWWQSGSSAAGANFLNLLDTDGATSRFKVAKNGATTINGNTTIGSVAGTIALDVNANANAASVPAPTSGAQARIVGADGTGNALSFDSFGSNNSLSMRRADGTAVSKTGLVANDIIGNVAFNGWTSAAAYSGNAVVVNAFATETWSGSANGASYKIRTTKNTTTALADAQIVDGFGHIQQGSIAPTSVSTCGTGAIVANSTDAAGQVNATGATACTLNFGNPYASAPNCVLTDNTSAVALKGVPSTGSLVVTGLTSGDTFTHICFAKVGG